MCFCHSVDTPTYTVHKLNNNKLFVELHCTNLVDFLVEVMNCSFINSAEITVTCEDMQLVGLESCGML